MLVRKRSSKEGSAGLVTLRDVPMMRWPETFLPIPPRTWRWWTEGRLETWATTLKADMEPLSGPWVFGYAQWRKNWVKVSSVLARAWGASIRDMICSFGDAGSIRPGWMPPQVQVSRYTLISASHFFRHLSRSCPLEIYRVLLVVRPFWIDE